MGSNTLATGRIKMLWEISQRTYKLKRHKKKREEDWRKVDVPFNIA